MKKYFKSYLVIWAVLLVLFNVIAFVAPGWSGQEKYTAAFWIGYALITVTFIGQLFCSHLAFKDDDANKSFYNVSLVTVSFTALIVSFVVGGLTMLLTFIPGWIGGIICAIILAFNVISVVKTTVAIEAVTDIDKKVKVQTFFIKSLTVDADTLCSYAADDEIKAECKKVYETIRYSDPMSNDALASAESQITLKFNEFSEAVKADEKEKVQSLGKELVILVEDRNKKCRMLK